MGHPLESTRSDGRTVDCWNYDRSWSSHSEQSLRWITGTDSRRRRIEIHYAKVDWQIRYSLSFCGQDDTCWRGRSRIQTAHLDQVPFKTLHHRRNECNAQRHERRICVSQLGFSEACKACHRACAYNLVGVSHGRCCVRFIVCYHQANGFNTRSLPLSALITPSTLTVVPDMKNITTSMAVPTLNLSDSSRYVFPGLPGGVSPLLTRTTVATASLGDILPMDAVLPNSTYTHVFNGSSLVCEPAKGRDLTVLDGVSNNLIDMLSQSQVRLSFLAYPCGTLMMPGADTNFQPFVQMVIIGSMPGGSNPGTYAAPTNYTFMHVRSGNGSLACKIQKTKYTTRFAASGDKQIATNTSVEVLGDVDSDNDVATALAQALMDILGGAIYAVSLAEFSIEGDCSGSTLYTINTRIMETNLIGLVDTSLTNDDDRPKCLADPSFTTLPTPTTKPATPWPSVMNATTGPQKRSPAADAPSPIPLSSVPFIPGLGPGVALVPGSTVPQSPDSISPADQALARNMSLASLIEELSRNLTLSLFSTSRLW